jgi:hypothetical protein
MNFLFQYSNGNVVGSVRRQASVAAGRYWTRTQPSTTEAEHQHSAARTQLTFIQIVHDPRKTRGYRGERRQFANLCANASHALHTADITTPR